LTRNGKHETVFDFFFENLALLFLILISSFNPSRVIAKTPTPQKSFSGDRYIPSRIELDRPAVRETLHSHQFAGQTANDVSSDASGVYQEVLLETMFGTSPSRVLMYSTPTSSARSTRRDEVISLNNASTLATRSGGRKTPRLKRKLARDPYRILDAPGLLDDFYLNLMVWNSNDVIAVALDEAVYLGDMTSGGVSLLCRTEHEHYVSSLEWIDCQHLAVGISSGRILLYDVETSLVIRRLSAHSSLRVSSLCWANTESPRLTSGGKDGSVVNHDLRIRNHIVTQWKKHTREVCRVTWSLDGKTLASGGNDDICCLWDAASYGTNTSTSPRSVLTDHNAAVKAIAWCPYDSSLLATGGGSADKTVKYWNARMGILKKSVYTGAQVCGLLWNPHEPELLSAHGFGGSRLSLWKYPSTVLLRDFPFRSDVRPLHLALCPKGSTVCVATSDEALKFWNMFTPRGRKNPDELSLSESYARVNGDDLPMSDDFWRNLQLR
jgi:cell division cycle protein 20 (cofactor of APC complex)